MPFRRPVAVGAIATLIVAAGLVGLHAGERETFGTSAGGDLPGGPAPPFVRTGSALFVPERSPLRERLMMQAADERQVAHKLQFPATIEAIPTRIVGILPPAIGRIVALNVGLGDRVRRGETLAVIASPDVAQAYSDYAKALDARALAKKTLDRARGVREAGGAAAKDLEAAQSAYAQALAELDRAVLALRIRGGSTTASDDAGELTVAAPLDGTVTALSAAPGGYINDVTASMMTVSNLDEVWATANVPEGDVPSITRDEPVDVTLPAYPGEVFHGRVAVVGETLEPDIRREKVRIVFQNHDDKLKPNMFALASVSLPQSPEVFVPQSALVMSSDDTTVFVETAPWTFERRAVELGYDEGANTRITRGLKPGERIVVRGAVLLND